MAVGENELRILIGGDSSGALGSIDQVNKGLGGLGLAGKGAVAGLVGMTAGVAVIGAVGAAAISAASDAQAATATIAAQTGLQGDALKEVAGVAKDVYENAFGESAASVAADVAKVKQAFGDLGADQLKDITESALTLKDAFGTDVQESLRGTSIMAKQFGIDGSAAFDIVTAVMQKSGDAHGDLLDTFQEYSPLMKQAGFNAEGFGDILVAGAQGGIRNYDLMADTVKEYGIRIRDTAKLSGDAFKALGIDQADFIAAIDSGAVSGREAFSQIVRSILEIEDPLKRQETGVALLGTKWEDVGEETLRAIANSTDGLENVAGATKRAGDALYDNVGTRWQSVQRQAMGALVPIGAGLLGLADTVLKNLAPAIEQLGPLIEGIGKAFAGETDFAAVLGPIGTVIDQIGGAFNALKNIFGGGDQAAGELQFATIINDMFGPDVAEKVTGFVQTVKAGLDDFMAKIGELTAAFEEGGISGLLDSLFGEGTGAAAEELGKTIQEYVVPGFQMLGEAAGAVIGFFADMFGQGVEAQLDSVADSGIKLKDVLGFVSDRIKDVGKAFEILGGLKDLVSIMAATLGQDFSDLGTRADTLKKAVGQAFSDLGTAADTLKTNVGQAFSDLGTGAQTLLTNAGTAFSGIGTKAGELKAAVGNAFSDLGTTVSTLASTIGSKTSEIGRNLIEGIKTGISGKLSELRTMVQGWADALPQWMKDRLNIKSPSTVFAEIGGQVVDGLIVGIKGGGPRTRVAIGDYVKIVTGAVATPAVYQTWAAIGGSWVQAIADGVKEATPGEKISAAMRAGIGTVPQVRLSADSQWGTVGKEWVGEIIEGVKGQEPKLGDALRGMAESGIKLYADEVQRVWERYKATLPILTPIATTGTFSGIPSVDNDPAIQGRAGAGYNGPGARSTATTVIVNGNVYGDRNLSVLLRGEARAAITQRTDAAVMRIRGVGAI